MLVGTYLGVVVQKSQSVVMEESTVGQVTQGEVDSRHNTKT